jgi:hypothetical protein
MRWNRYLSYEVNEECKVGRRRPTWKGKLIINIGIKKAVSWA